MQYLKPLLVAASLLLSSQGVQAQEACNLPSSIPAPKLQKIDCANNSRPDSFVLALSWSPQYCASTKHDSEDFRFQCEKNKFGFVVHGLWPQNSNAKDKCDHPRHCEQSVVDKATVQKNLCTVPSIGLIQGQWQKHGSCSGLSAPAYFDKTRALSQALTKPDLSRLVNADGYTTAGEIIQAFVQANQSLKLPRDAVAVQVGSKNAFREVFICYDLNYRFTTCTNSRTPDKQRVFVTPKG